MPREPNLVIFQCESCEVQLTADARSGNHLLPWKRKLPIEADGVCRKCGGNTWTISVLYADVNLDLGPTAVGTGLEVTTGFGFSQSTTHVNRRDYPNVNARVVAKLNEIPAERMTRVTAFAANVEREQARQRGARECAACRALFVPTPGKPWTDEGFCSKMCRVEVKGMPDTPETDHAFGGKPSRSNTVDVQCAEGHHFEAPISFCGLPRPCPECGRKTVVPEVKR